MSTVVQLADRRTARSTYDAIRTVLYEHGMKYRHPDWLLERLARCPQSQIRELLAWIDQRNINHALKGTGRPIPAEVRALVARFLR